MSTFPDKFLALKECSFDSTDESYLPNKTSYHRASSKKGFSQLFDLDLVTISLSMTEAFELSAWLIDNSSGTHGIFKINNPFNVLLQPKETRNIASRSSILKHAKSVPAQNFTPSIVEALKPGTFFTFANHVKVYMVTNSPNANGLGQSTITFTPGLYQDVPANTQIKYGDNCQFQVSCKADVQSLTASVSASRRTSITIPVRERA